MIELRCVISADSAQPLEDFFCELARSPWMIYNERPSEPCFLVGYFDSAEEATDAWADLRKVFAALPETPAFHPLADCDWKEAYKAHLHPWSHGRLHWVPEWRRADYAVGRGDAVVYFDAGLAFGTGDHPTTRLCALRLLDFLAAGKDPASVSVIDAGCGSGILALSAAKLGCATVRGFDRDAEAVRVSLENRAANGLEPSAAVFVHAGIEDGLRGVAPADVVLANIISDVLCIYADNLLAAVAPGGVLALGGILVREQAAVRELFEVRARAKWGGVGVDVRVMGEWGDLALFRPV
ncbi:MAG: 50S ribosomal protein L11 methyltransferase [Puniceicoccales bacterium]|jgi:ribosomal protein L11 methyltransferase|nr:50S ribosomal protein L11 methyltransferase [Puniceicoccales bacterium]